MLRRTSSTVLKALFIGMFAMLVVDSSTVLALPANDTSPLPRTAGHPFTPIYQLRLENKLPATINNVPISNIVVMTPAVKANVRALYAKGLRKGNNPLTFSALGDSTIAGGLFLERFSAGDYKLGDYAYLQTTLTAFAGSMARTSASVRIGLHSWTALNPVWADKKRCEPDENTVDCEFRLNKPSILFIHLGANDTSNSVFDKNLRKIVQYVMDAGVVPVLITKAEPPDSDTHANNDSVRAIAKVFNVPLIDFESLANTLPNYGLGDDKVHMTSFNKVDYSQPALFKSGHAMHNLAALIALDAVWKTATTID